MKLFHLMVTCIVAVLLIPTGGRTEGEQKGTDKTLSPYFFVETSDEDIDRFPLKHTDVHVDISGIIAEVTVRQQYANMGAVPLHGRYIFPASTRAAVHGMKMMIGDRVVTAVIKEKTEARRVFDEAKKQGKSSSLLEQQRPNVFSMEIANIMPGDTVDVELRYSELLIPEAGQYEFVYPTVVGPRYSTMAEEGSPPAEQWVKNPYLRQQTEPRTTFSLTSRLSAGMAIQEISCPSHQTTVSYSSETEASIELAETGTFGGDRDYILRYRLAGRQISSGLLLSQSPLGNYFLLLAEPPQHPADDMIVPREYIFVVDISGSMHGFPLDTAKQLMTRLLSGLRPTDSFNLLLFAGEAKLLSPHSLPATASEVRRALGLLDKHDGGGGTELIKAMTEAYQLPRMEDVSRSIVVITDGYINVEADVFDLVSSNLGSANVFAFGIGSSVNRYLIEGMARSGQGEPFIVTSPSEAGSVADRFAEYVAAPVLTDISVSFDGLDVFDVEPPAVPDLFAQRPVVLFGKWRGAPAGTITVSGRNGEHGYRQVFRVADAAGGEGHDGLAYLWARHRLARLADYAQVNRDDASRQEIINLGLTYNLLTAFTSFVAVDEMVRNPSGQAEHVKQPLPLPQGVSNLAIAGMQQVPEPELKLFVILGLAVALALLRRWYRSRSAAPISEVVR